jgi:hypothetical protein
MNGSECLKKWFSHIFDLFCHRMFPLTPPLRTEEFVIRFQPKENMRKFAFGILVFFLLYLIQNST